MWSRGLEGTRISSGAAPTFHALSWGWWKPSMGGVKNVIPRMTYGKEPSLILVSGIVFCISRAIAVSILLLIFNPLGSCDSSSLISLSWWHRSSETLSGHGSLFKYVWWKLRTTEIWYPSMIWKMHEKLSSNWWKFHIPFSFKLVLFWQNLGMCSIFMLGNLSSMPQKHGWVNTENFQVSVNTHSKCLIHDSNCESCTKDQNNITVVGRAVCQFS